MKTAVSATAASTSDASPRVWDATASAAGICEPHACHIERDSAHGRIAPYGHCCASPADMAAMPSASWRSAVAAVVSDGTASTRAASPRTASAEASAPFTISHAGTLMPSDSAHSP